MIRTQLKLFAEETKKKTKKIIIRQSSSNYFRGWNDVIASMAKNFSASDRKYFAGMTDGDGTLRLHPQKNRPNPCLRIGLELVHDKAEPILKLAEMFDLTISKKIYLIPYGNTQPTLKVELSGIKAKVFLLSIYPYLLEEKDKARSVLISLGCPKERVPEERQFSFEYLAGYTDAEGTVTFKLQHQKTKIGNITSYYQMRYELSNNDNAHLQFLKKNLIDLGFDHFRKDYIDFYEKEKREGRKGANPDKWKPTTHIYLGGTPTQLSKFYKNVEPFILIKHKKDNMLSTMKYNDIITMNK
tara:strand:- start:540 stop:1436 length:897 start_codon:yes stop_codon:yes gene_type:complete